ncbi:DciA family protein [Actinomycetaceae bacterium MB13-C1-2]|nr:DciA family protein [Actinomycetaceae bacterium MB13-C1-2]
MTEPTDKSSGVSSNQKDSGDSADDVLSELFDKYRSRGRGYTGRRPRRKRRLTPGAVTNRIVEEAEDALEHHHGWVPSPGMYRSKTGTGPSKYDPRPIGAILDKEVRDRDWQRSLATGQVIGQWEEIVGDVVAQHCPIESFDGGRLVVQADSTAWAQQLKILLPEVMGAIDRAVGSGIVESVVVLPPRAPSWKHGPRSVPGRGPRDTYG